MADSPPHEIIVIQKGRTEDWESLRQQCFDIRVQVFHHEQKFPLDTEFDEHEDTAAHILLRLIPSLTPVGTIRCIKNKHYYKLTRLAVLKQYRKFRFGSELVLALHEHAMSNAHTGKKLTSPTATAHAPAATATDILPTSDDLSAGDSDVVRIQCHSQIPVKSFYARLSYEPEGEEFEEDGAPHQLMVARLSLSDTEPTTSQSTTNSSATLEALDTS